MKLKVSLPSTRLEGEGDVGCCYRMYSLYNFLTAHLCLYCEKFK